MTSDQLLKTIHKDFVIEGKGKSKEEAFGNIFAILRKKVYQHISGVILHMEPLEVYIMEESIREHTERFLGIFMPRTKKEYVINAKIIVLIKYIEI